MKMNNLFKFSFLFLFTIYGCNSVKQNNNPELSPLVGHWKTFREIQLEEDGKVKKEVSLKNNLVVSKKGAFIYWSGLEADTGTIFIAQPFFFNKTDSLLGIGSERFEDFPTTKSRAHWLLFKTYFQNDSILVLQPTTKESNPKPLPFIMYFKKIK